MNKQELITQADKLQKELDILKEKIEQCDKENIRWRAKRGEKYYYLAFHGLPLERTEDDTMADDYCYSIGAYFKTKQEAQDYKENLITKQKLKDLALRLNGESVIDWENALQNKFCIYYSNEDEVCLQNNCWSYQYGGQVYCLDKNFLTIAIKEIGKKALVKLIKSGL